MVDVLAYFEQEVRLAERFDDCGCRPGLLCARCAESILHKFKNDLKYGNNDDIRPENVKELTDLQYFLCPHAVPAYSFKTREWGNYILSCSRHCILTLSQSWLMYQISHLQNLTQP